VSVSVIGMIDAVAFADTRDQALFDMTPPDDQL
jgi:hypothetical protein